MKHRLPIILINLVVVCIALLHSAGVLQLPGGERLEDLLYDVRVKLTLPKGVDERIVIVDIDEHSLREEGHFPWSRDKMAYLTDQLFDRYQIAALGFDIVFAEKEENREIEALRQVAQDRGQTSFIAELDVMAADLDRDRRFAQALSDRPITLGYYFNTNPERTESSGMLPMPLAFDDSVKNALVPPRGSSYGANIEPLQSSVASAGFFSNPLLGQDGIVRRVPTVHEFDGNFYESFAMAVARTYLGVDIEPALAEVDPSTGYPSLEGLYVGPFYVPVDANGGVLVPYRGRSGSFPYVSATHVLRDKLPNPEVLKDAIVLVGTTSLGLVDLRSTPVQAAFPGVEVHANVLAGLIDENFKHRPAWVWGAEFLVLLVSGLLMIALSPFLGPLRLWFLGAVMLLLLVGANVYLWNEKNLVMPLANSVTLIVVLYILDVMYGFFTEAKGKRLVREAFSHYLSPALVAQLAEDPSKLRLAGETREMTFLFSDIAGFTSFTEKNDPEVLVSLLNEYLDGMCQVVMAHGGTIDKIVGDAIHAIFNAPLEQPDHAARAVNCAIAMDEFSTNFIERKRKEGINFGITRIGVNTGNAVVGNFGGSERFDYTAHGDAINTAARMESVNKHLGTRLCVAGSTASLCPDLNFRPVGALVLKGKTEAVEAYEPITAEQNASERVKKYIAAYRHLEQADPESEHLFDELKNNYPDDPLVALHMGRIKAGEVSSTIVMAEK